MCEYKLGKLNTLGRSCVFFKERISLSCVAFSTVLWILGSLPRQKSNGCLEVVFFNLVKLPILLNINSLLLGLKHFNMDGHPLMISKHGT